MLARHPGIIASAGAASGGTPGNTGQVSASAGTNVADGGTTWQNPGNITASDDARTNYFRTSPGVSALLYAQFFGLSAVPDGATITGVEVWVERDYSSTGECDVRDHTIRLTKDGSTMVGDNKADSVTPYTKTDTVIGPYGGASDLWGTTLTAAEVKAASFGVMIKGEHISTPAAANGRIDHVQIRVSYTHGAVAPSPVGTLVWQSDEDDYSVGAVGPGIFNNWGTTVVNFNPGRFSIANDPGGSGEKCIRGELPAGGSSANCARDFGDIIGGELIDIALEAEFWLHDPSPTIAMEDLKLMRISGRVNGAAAERNVVDDPSATISANSQNGMKDETVSYCYYVNKPDSFGEVFNYGDPWPVGQWVKIRKEVRGGSGDTSGTIKLFRNDELLGQESGIRWHTTAGAGWRHIGATIDSQFLDVNYHFFFRNVKIYALS